MSAGTIAEHHFSAAIEQAQAENVDVDTLCRAILNLVVSQYLQMRPVADVQSELHFIAENCDPDTDFNFMRP